ncbi:MAG TPA: nuclear transport factor 2 family protein [Puia sp.]|nr:nuclear transport factor 2 family protein [Puia sp.]
MKNALFLAFLLAVAGRTQVQAQAPRSAAEKEIFAAMDTAAAQWNRGDLDGYMSLYDASATMMLSSGRVGLDSIRGMYVKYYFAGGHPRQQLSYDTYELTMLGKNYALLTGRFILKADERHPGRKGTFSLTMVRRKDGWKILHDHSG